MRYDREKEEYADALAQRKKARNSNLDFRDKPRRAKTAFNFFVSEQQQIIREEMLAEQQVMCVGRRIPRNVDC